MDTSHFICVFVPIFYIHFLFGDTVYTLVSPGCYMYDTLTFVCFVASFTSSLHARNALVVARHYSYPGIYICPPLWEVLIMHALDTLYRTASSLVPPHLPLTVVLRTRPTHMRCVHPFIWMRAHIGAPLTSPIPLYITFSFCLLAFWMPSHLWPLIRLLFYDHSSGI